MGNDKEGNIILVIYSNIDKNVLRERKQNDKNFEFKNSFIYDLIANKYK